LRRPRGAFVTTSRYTNKAREDADKEGFKRTVLIQANNS